ncbi:MAG: hypothetical protein ACE5I1_11735 [bacterium]
MPKLSESLADRMEILTLYPLSQGELEQKQKGLIDWLFSDKPAPAMLLDNSSMTLWQRIADGGYPEVVKRQSRERKKVWLRDYVTTMLHRDMMDYKTYLENRTRYLWL